MRDQDIRLLKRFTLIVLLSVSLLVPACSAMQVNHSGYQITSNGTGPQNDLSSHGEVTHIGEHYVQGAFGTAVMRERSPPVTEKLLVLKAKLSDKTFGNPFSQMNSTMSVDVKNYYQEISYDQVVISASVISKNYSLGIQQESYYGNDPSPPNRLVELVNTVVNLAQADVALLGGYHVFKHLIIMHSGTDYAKTLNPGDIHSEFIFGFDIVVGSDHITNASIVSEDDPLGVIVHELGHSQGLPDLYDYSLSPGTPDDFVGGWDLMATGSWNPNYSGTSPAHMSTWCKIGLGWINSTHVVSISESSISGGNNVTVLLNSHELLGKTMVLNVTLDNGTFYLIEGRSKIGYDTGLPGSGVLVLFCNDSKGNGDGPVRVVSAHSGLGADAAYNVGWLQEDFFGDTDTDIGMKVLNRWDNGTYKVIVGEYTAVLNTPSEYVSPTFPISVIIFVVVVLAAVVAIAYLKKGRQKTAESGYAKIQVIKAL